MDDDKPPSKSKLDIGSRVIPSAYPLAGRLKGIWAILTSDWNICPIRSPLLGRCANVLKNL